MCSALKPKAFFSDYFYKSAVISQRRAKTNKGSQKYSNKQKLVKIVKQFMKFYVLELYLYLVSKITLLD